MSLLAVDELRVRVATDDRPLQIVDGVSYAVDEGRIFGIAGESGSGKTVSVLALMGLLPRGASVTGTARFEGNDLVSMPSARLREVCGREIGLVFQDPLTSFHPMLSVGRQLTEHLRHHYGTSRTDARGRAVALLEEVRIPDPETALERYPHEFSGGMRQRSGCHSRRETRSSCRANLRQTERQCRSLEESALHPVCADTRAFLPARLPCGL